MDNPNSLVDPLCAFWDESLDGGFGDWSVDGCVLVAAVEDSSPGDVQCECDHLSTFALLLVSSYVLDLVP